MAEENGGGGAVPVTLLSGFLGSGKTTLLRKILSQTDGRGPDGTGDRRSKYKVAVLVNDMASVNIDANLVRDTKLLQKEAKMVELHNGCICCTLREDLIKELADLAAANQFDAIVVESTGVSDPQEVAETFAVEVGAADLDVHDADADGDEEMEEGGKGEGSDDGEDDEDDEDDEDEQGGMAPQSWELESIIKALRGKSSLNELARLDTCVTMVDAAAFRSNLGTAAELQERFKEEGGADEGDDRNVAPLLMSQIEFADVIGLSKCDLVSEAEASSVENALRALNPGAKVIRANRGDLPLSTILDTKLFSMDRAASSAGWLQHMRDEKVVPETEVYGIDSFVYKARTPFHTKRLYDFFLHHFMVRMRTYGPDGPENDGDDDDDDDEEEEEEEEKMEEEEAEGSVQAAAGQDADDAAAAAEEAKEREIESSKRQKKMRESFGSILRSKGYVWLAGRDALVGEWSQSGAVGEFGCGGSWYAEVPKEEWPEDEESLAMLQQDFDGPELMDRRQEIVFIGQNLKEDAITAALDACLVQREELQRRDASTKATEHSWKFGIDHLEDKFPKW